jgi:hypothetical protein
MATLYYFVPWENRFDWEEKGIKPIKLTRNDFDKMERKENDT